MSLTFRETSYDRHHLRITSGHNLTDEQFYQLYNNPDIKLERPKGELIVMPPTGWGRVKYQANAAFGKLD